MTYEPDDVTDEELEAVEAQCSHTSGAWDMVDPKEIIAAAWNVLHDKMMLDAKRFGDWGKL